MAKLSKRLTVKGMIDYENLCVIEYDKEGNETMHKFEDIFTKFKNLDDVILTLSYDETVQGEAK